jgi:hypothetical protein
MDVVWANPPRRHTDIAFVAEARHFDRTRLPSQEFRGTHMVRDPRDMIVSGYFYHLWTTEDWAQEPRAELGGLSYREHLNQLDVGDGLTAEIERAVAPGGNIDEMLRWDYHSKEFLELRYEDFIADEQSEFARLFRHYGFTEDAIALGVARGERYNFKNISRRNLGEVAPGQHLRSGRPGSWREHFGPQHREAFKALTGDLLVALGYEENQGW